MMNRKNFLKYTSLASLALVATNAGLATSYAAGIKTIHPLAITMWDFSWLERRWEGGSYENWDKVLDELKERGYNAVRIDAYPHLVAADANKEWTLLPAWDQQDWGSPGKIKVTIYPALKMFITKCKQRNIKVALSTWYREDVDNTRRLIDAPEKMAAAWIETLHLLAKDNLHDTLLYVDLCNEWTSFWSPMLQDPNHNWAIPTSLDWMKKAIGLVKEKHPSLPYTFSFDNSGNDLGDKLKNNPLPHFDLLEYHLWMASLNNGEFNKTVGYNWHRFSSESYKNLIENGENLYRSKPQYWQNMLIEKIKVLANAANNINQPLITTECWGIVDYKDYPLLNWGWIKELCALGVTTAAGTGQWVAIASSNFCGPQFKGMWNDIEWHKKMTSIIKNSKVNNGLLNAKIISRLTIK